MESVNMSVNTLLVERFSAAFFDLDDTLLDMHTMKLFAQYLADSNVVSQKRVTAMLEDVEAAVLAGKKREETNGIFFEILSDLTEGEYYEYGRQWWKNANKKFMLPILSEFTILKSNGVHLIAISGSYSCCVNAICEDIGMNAAFGSEPDIFNSILTGRVRLPMVGRQKKKQLLTYLKNNPELSGLTLAYGDHPSDFPMLSAVTHPRFFQKNLEFCADLNYVKSQGWKVIENDL